MRIALSAIANAMPFASEGAGGSAWMPTADDSSAAVPEPGDDH